MKPSLSPESRTTAPSLMVRSISAASEASERAKASWPTSRRVPTGEGKEKEVGGGARSPGAGAGGCEVKATPASKAPVAGPRMRFCRPTSTAAPASARTLAEKVQRRPRGCSMSVEPPSARKSEVPPWLSGTIAVVSMTVPAPSASSPAPVKPPPRAMEVMRCETTSAALGTTGVPTSSPGPSQPVRMSRTLSMSFSPTSLSLSNQAIATAPTRTAKSVTSAVGSSPGSSASSVLPGWKRKVRSAQSDSPSRQRFEPSSP